MSNCLHIHNPLIVLRKDCFDMRAFDDMLATTTPTRDGTGDGYMRYWFYDGSRCDSATAVRLDLGACRSIFTWRDLGAYLFLLARYAVKPVVLYLTMSDESDGFKSKFKVEYRLYRGNVKWLVNGQYQDYRTSPLCPIGEIAQMTIDWRQWANDPKSECTCRCMMADLKDGDIVPYFLSHVKYLRGLGLVSQTPCPKCGSHSNLRSARGSETFTVRASDVKQGRV